LGVGGQESTPHKKVYTSEPSFLISHSWYIIQAF
jgi:hypothetical protein